MGSPTAAVTARRRREAPRRPRPTSRRGRVVARRLAAGLPALRPRRVVDVSDAADEASPRGDVRRTSTAVRRRRHRVLAGMGVLTVAGVALAVGGLSAVRNSTAGRYQQAIGPAEPGYQASVVPTPTLGVLVRGGDGHLAGAAVLALAPGDAGGNVVVVPAATVVTGADGTERTLDDAYVAGGVDAAADALGRATTVSIGETVALGPEAWAQLVEPVGPVTVTIDDAVAEWPAGEVELAPDQVGPFLSALGGDEEELARTNRQEAFWDAWLPLVRDAGATVLPGEVETGFGRFVRGIAGGDGTAFALPVAREDSGQGPRYRVDGLRLGDLVSATIPFPVSPAPGVRVRVRLLNGTEQPELTEAAARALVAFGAEVAIVGNAGTLAEPETRFVYADPAVEERAAWMAAALGAGRLEQVGAGQDGVGAEDEGIDVTVILGQDAVDPLGEEQTSD